MGRSSFRLAMWHTSLVVALMCTTSFRVNGLPHPPATSAAPMMERMVERAYDDKFDNVDLDEILNQERLLINYIKCLEGTGPCTPDAKMLKEILPDAIQTDCTKCTEKQRYGAEKVTRHLIDNRPTDWERLEKIYDPEGLYRIKYEEMKAKANEES
ncbi:putative odorant-binding protein A10 [Drosophila subpulchrella]|uniref:putative odorant-binding protein A10 n=1 Tax=Drosophila subpulchrella TaxID=1486046 RepID=UPI0018A19AB3|nr:putative odorant-binding protein A10 [Drosophila subpulchrella]